ncbi:hypothetical protein KJB52_10825 [Staphylococcus chromogenes]|uniref:hypothetical protein n=1 Tax=Staphylococcus chromogenes TaxID=46126 RepID=UPI001F405F9C|nr:hypothetical protein [Staphylococcus chromogenes]MCE5093408.1 hypothetical protein [Staphylococcus chromogenes]
MAEWGNGGMKLEEFLQVRNSLKFIIEKFAENPARFATIMLKMYLDAVKERDAYKSERDTLIEDITRLRVERDELSKKLDEYCNVSLNIEGQLVEISKERDELILSNARLIDDNARLKRKLDDVVDLFTRHINYKLSVSHNTWYINLRHRLDEVLQNDTR